MAEPEPTKETKARVPRRHRKRSLWRRLGLGSLLFTLCLTVVLFALAYLVVGRPVTLPERYHARIEADVSARIPNADIRFRELQFVLRDGWQPRLRLQDLRFVAPDGAQIVAFAQVDAALEFEPLLRGQVVPSELWLTGVVAKITRDSDGGVALSGGTDVGGPLQEAANVTELIEQVDRLLMTRPELSRLKTAEIQALTLRVEDAAAGQAWTIDGGRMRLTQQDNYIRLSADFALLDGGTGIATVEANYASEIGRTEAVFGINMQDVAAKDIAAQSPVFGWLDILRAPISGAMRSGINADGSMQTLSATLTIGEGVVQPNDATDPVPFNAARTYFTFDPADQSLTFDELYVASNWITGRAEGQAFLGSFEGGSLSDLVGQFQLTDVRFNPADLYESAISIDEAAMDFRLTPWPFRFELGQMHIQDQNRALTLKGDLKAETDGWTYALDGQMDSLNSARLKELWPENLAPKTRKWLGDNLLTAQFQRIDLALRGEPGARPQTYVSFDYDEADIRYAPTLPVVTSAKGHASLLHNRLVVAVDEGLVTPPEGGALDVAGSSFIVPDITVKPGAPSITRLEAAGSLTAMLSLLDEPPMNVLSNAGRNVSFATGDARVRGTLALPLRKGVKFRDMAFDATGEITNAESLEMVPGRVFTAPLLTVIADDEAISVSGAGLLDELPFDATWRQVFEPGAAGRVEGTVELSARAADTFNLGQPPDAISGTAIGTFEVDLLREEPPRFRVLSDMAGLGLNIAPIGWAKARSSTGEFRLEGRAGPVPVIDLVSLNAPGLSASGTVSLREGGGLDRARLDQVRVGGWLQAPVDLVGRGPGTTPAIFVRGGSIDLRNAEFGTGGGGSSGGSTPLRVALERLQVTDTIVLNGFEGRFESGSGLGGDFSASVNGRAPITGTIAPRDGRSTIQVSSSNAGATLDAAGVFRNSRGGDLSLVLRPVGENGVFDGTLSVRNTQMRNVPLMAELLSSLSIVGLLEQLSGDGIGFSEVDASFRMTPSVIALTEASAVGPSMGISMDGTYRVSDKALDMQGVISPVYFLNSIGSIFTRQGEGLIGFSYRVGGTADDPSVQVNPLSALTPGTFREIFRSPPPTVTSEGEVRRKWPKRREREVEER